MIEFVDIQNKFQVVPKSAYIEVNQDIFMLERAGEFVHLALANFAFNSEFKDTKIIGIKIDVSGYSYFNIEDRLKDTTSSTKTVNNFMENASDKIKNPSFAGSEKIMTESDKAEEPCDLKDVAYIDKYIVENGYGFLSQDNSDESIFFHISHVKDETLKEILSIPESFDGSGHPLKKLMVKFEHINYKGRPQAEILNAL